MTVISYRQALHDTLRAELQRDENRILRYRHVNIGIATTMTLTLSIDHRAVHRPPGRRRRRRPLPHRPQGTDRATTGRRALRAAGEYFNKKSCLNYWE
jgi:hypothetical protein